MKEKRRRKGRSMQKKEGMKKGFGERMNGESDDKQKKLE